MRVSKLNKLSCWFLVKNYFTELKMKSLQFGTPDKVFTSCKFTFLRSDFSSQLADSIMSYEFTNYELILSFSRSETYSESYQTLEMEMLTIFSSFSGFWIRLWSLSLIGEIFTQKSNNWFDQKKKEYSERFYHDLHISEKDKKL